jgi:hypothetical protein
MRQNCRRKTELGPLITASENSLVGSWQVIGGRVTSNEACARIAALTSGYLLELGHADGGWSTLYRDPADGRLWERTYPQSELHGGGPASLHVVSAEQARAKYGYSA